MITITPNADGRVMRIGYADRALPKGAIEVASIPQEPTLEEGKACELYWNGKALEWRIFDAPPPPEPEPIPEPEEPQPPTEEELAEMRRQAYVAECDPYSMAYVGYMLEGDEDKAMSARASYLERKAEIRKRFKE
jgi:hypothetical protein